MPATGEVKWFSKVKGYGFIAQQGGPDVFVHYKAIGGEKYKKLKGGDTVAYEVAEGPKGPQASNVVKQEKKETKGQESSAAEKSKAAAPKKK